MHLVGCFHNYITMHRFTNIHLKCSLTVIMNHQIAIYNDKYSMKGMSILIQNNYVFKLTLLRCFLLNKQNSLNISRKFLKRVLLYFPSHHSCTPIAHSIMLLSDTTKSEGKWKVWIEIYLFHEVMRGRDRCENYRGMVLGNAAYKIF